MPYRHQWIIQNRLMFTEGWGTISLEEFQEYDRFALNVLKDCGPFPVHTFYDLARMESMPKLSHLAKMESSKHPLLGWTLVLGIHRPMIRFVLTSVATVSRVKMRFCTTMDEARDYLLTADDTMSILRTLDIDAIRRGETLPLR